MAEARVGKGPVTERRREEGARHRRREAVRAHHFGDLESQVHAAQLGMWVFLAGEVLLFGALFALYAGYRVRFPEVFGEATRHTDAWVGAGGTIVLLLASLLVALSIHATREDRRQRTGRLLLGATTLGGIFLLLKGWEWMQHIQEGLLPGPYYDFPELTGQGAMAFFTLYYVMTGVHFLHVTGGVGVLLWLWWRNRRQAFDAEYHVPLELGGMYWHLVDVIWLFLWPAFYLMR